MTTSLINAKALYYLWLKSRDVRNVMYVQVYVMCTCDNFSEITVEPVYYGHLALRKNTFTQNVHVATVGLNMMYIWITVCVTQ